MQGRLDASILKPLYVKRSLPNLKIPLFYGIWTFLLYLGWNEPSWYLKFFYYLGAGYMQMGIVTFMHDCTHEALFRARWKNTAFGIFAMIPFVISFTAFKDDHLRHHQFNRTPKDPDAIFMGTRSFADFVLFYSYCFFGGILTAFAFTILYAITDLRGKKLAVHCGEMILRFAFFCPLFWWASKAGLTGKILEVWLVPLGFFTIFNSIRFVAEHYGTPWNVSQLVGSRTVTSNPVHSFFWNNINYHIGHHVYPAVPWYNLQELHKALLPEIREAGAIVERSCVAVFIRALIQGPELLPDQSKEWLLSENSLSTN